MKTIEEVLACKQVTRLHGVRCVYSGLCAGCGEVFYAVRLPTKGHAVSFCGRDCHTSTGDARWQGGHIDSGYRKVRGGRREHRVVMAKKLGRELLPSEIVHHEDKDKLNNTPENLTAMTRTDHNKLHLAKRYANRR